MTAISDTSEDNMIVISEKPDQNTRTRSFLVRIAQQRVPITYQDLAKALRRNPQVWLIQFDVFGINNIPNISQCISDNAHPCHATASFQDVKVLCRK